MWSEGHLLQSGKYSIKKQIGGGGFGLTYLAEDTFLRRQVVIKTPNRQFQNDQDYEQFVRRFKREGQALSKVNHSNVVQVIEYFQEAGIPCLVMAYVKGETLNERIRNKGRLSPDEAVKCFRKIAEALHTLHQRGLIHCDVHPGNIILRSDGEPMLIDFGSAKLLQPGTFTVTTTVNESFAPYEQSNKENDPKPTLDVYALAATLYFAVTGQKPQASMSRKMFGDKLQSPQQLHEEIQGWLNQAILKGLALESNDRPASMQVWMGSLHLPQPTKTDQSQPSSSITNGSIGQPDSLNSKKVFRNSRRANNFPWWGLSILLIGYLPAGSILYLLSKETNLWTIAGLWTLAVSVAGTGGWTRDWDWALAGAVVLVMAGAGAGGWALAVTGAGVWAAAAVVAVAWAVVAAGFWGWSGGWPGDWAGGSLAVAILGGGVIGYFSSLGLWGGLGIGLLSLIQLFLIIGGLNLSSEKLEKHYQSFKVFVVLEGISILGMVIGAIMSWLFGLSTNSFTTWG